MNDLESLTEARLHLALDAGRMGAWQYDIAADKVTWSATLERIHGVEEGSFGGSFEDYERDIHPADRERVLGTIARSLTGEAEHHLTYRILRPDGAVRWLEAFGRLLRDEAGRPSQMLGVCCDVTERIEAEEHRQELLLRTEHAVRAREDLLAMVSHDLRDPLGVIVMTSEVLGESVQTEEMGLLAQVERIRRAAERMDELISNLLDASNIETASFAIRVSDTEIGTLLAESIEASQPLVARKRLSIDLECKEPNLQVSVDRARVAQVLANLLGNAVKFSPEGAHIVVGAQRSEAEVVLSVSDSGPGIAPEHLTLVFERYWKGKQSGRAGTGLGLFIARGIVQAHGGRIWVESSVGHGSSFFVALPLTSR